MNRTLALLLGLPLALLAACSGNSAPATVELALRGLDAPITVAPGDVVTIRFEGGGSVDIYADEDGDPATTDDRILIARDLPVGPANWDTTAVPPGVYRIVVEDDEGGMDVSGGTVTVELVARFSIVSPATDTLVSAGNRIAIDYIHDEPNGVGRVWIYADADGRLETTGDRFTIVDEVPDEDGRPQRGEWDTTGVPLGLYRLLVFLVDADGNDSELSSHTIEVVANVADLKVVRGSSGTQLLGVRVADDGAYYVSGARHDDSIAGVGGPYIARYKTDGTLDWERVATGPGAKSSTAVDFFADGSCVSVGTFQRDVVFGAGEATETTISAPPGKDYDIFIARYNADGTFAWVRAFGDSGQDGTSDVAALPDGSCVWVGHFWGTVALDASNTLSVPAGVRGGVVARYAADGSVLWTRSWGNTGLNSATGVSLAVDGSLLVCGNFEGTIVLGAGETNETTLTSTGGTDLVLARYEADGSLRWARSFGGAGSDSGRRPIERTDGTIVLSGSFQGELTFGADALVSVGNNDMFVAGFTSTGGPLFAHSFGGSGHESGQRLAVRPDGSFVWTGYSNSTFDFGPTRIENRGNWDVLVAGFAADGTLLWARSDGGNGGDLGLCIDMMPDGTPLVVGLYGSPANSATFGRGEANETETTPTPGVGGEGFIARYNLDGRY
ncbi:MAG: hypothetical protein AAGD14_00590 [Planctomycetota bacterium]